MKHIREKRIRNKEIIHRIIEDHILNKNIKVYLMSKKDFKTKNNKKIGPMAEGCFLKNSLMIWIDSNKDNEKQVINLIHECGHFYHYINDRNNCLGKSFPTKENETINQVIWNNDVNRELYAFNYTYEYLSRKKWTHKKRLLKRFKKIIKIFCQNDKQFISINGERFISAHIEAALRFKKIT